jgi:hypothetical protein
MVGMKLSDGDDASLNTLLRATKIRATREVRSHEWL